MQSLDLCGDDYRGVGFEKEGLPAKATSFNFSVHRGGKPIAYFNRFLRVLKTFLICRRKLSARGGVTPREKRVISLAACVVPGSVCTSAFYIDKNEDEQERFPCGGLERTAGCLSSAAGCAHHGSGRVYQHRVFNVTTFQLGLVSPSAASDGCSLSGSDSFRSLIPLAPLFARRDRRCERVERGGCTCNMYVTSYISRVRHTWDGTAGRRRRWISGWQYVT